jgi:hypothetical protein
MAKLKSKMLPSPIDYVFYPLREGDRIEDIEAYKTKGNCLAPEVCEGDILTVNRRLTPQVGDLVVAYWRGIVAYYRVDQDGQPYLQNGHGIFSIPSNATCGVVTGRHRKLK